MNLAKSTSSPRRFSLVGRRLPILLLLLVGWGVSDQSAKAGEILLTTIDATMTDFTDSVFPDKLDVAFEYSHFFPSNQLGVQIGLDPAQVGGMTRFDLGGQALRTVNTFWADGRNSPGIELDLNGGISGIDPDDSLLLLGFNDDGARFDISAVPSISAVTSDLQGLDLRVTHFVVTVEDVEQMTTGDPPSRFATTVNFTVEIFGAEGAIPEPSSSIMICTGGLLFGAMRRRNTLSVRC